MDALGKFGEHFSEKLTLTLFSCSPNVPRSSTTRYRQAENEPLLDYNQTPLCPEDDKGSSFIRSCIFQESNDYEFGFRLVLQLNPRGEWILLVHIKLPILI